MNKMDWKKPVKIVALTVCIAAAAVAMGVFAVGANFITCMVWGDAPTASDSKDEAPLPAPEISAKTAVVMEKESGKILYEKNPHEKVFPASTTKIMTALLAIENGDLNQTVKVSDAAVGVEGSSIYLERGEALPLADLVYGLMLRSGNDAAVAIACEISGDMEGFVDLMNQRAQEIGAFNTHFMNPNGLHDENHYTTAYDMALIGRTAMHNPAFKKVAGTKSYTADRGEGKYNYFYNKNKVVYQYSGGTGIKIGYTKVAGRTLVASSERDGMELICVVMAAPDWFNDTYKLMDYAYSRYDQKVIAKAGTKLRSMKVTGGDKERVFVGPRADVTCPVPKGADNSLSIQYLMDDSVKVPVRRGEQAGLMNVYEGEEFLYAAPIYFMEDIE